MDSKAQCKPAIGPPSDGLGLLIGSLLSAPLNCLYI